MPGLPGGWRWRAWELGLWERGDCIMCSGWGLIPGVMHQADGSPVAGYVPCPECAGAGNRAPEQTSNNISGRRMWEA